MTPKRLFIVDAMAMAFRNYHAFGVRPISTSYGLATSSIFGCAQFLIKLLGEEQPDYMVIATDSQQPTFRHELFDQYKANRGEMPEDLAVQLPHLFEMFSLLGCPLIAEPGMEADDLIGSLVHKYRSPDLNCYIVSGDKDFMQLIDENTFLYIPQKGGGHKIIDTNGVHEKFNCQPFQVIDILALLGDSSDNIPGVRGIGEKGATKLISEFGSLDGIYANLDNIRNEKLKNALANAHDVAYLSRKLATIKTDIKTLPELSELACVPGAWINKDLLNFFQKMEFRKLTEDLNQLLAAAPVSEDTNRENSATSAVALVDKNYRLIQDATGLNDLVELLKEAPYFAFDTETTGLNIVTDRPIGISFATKPGNAFYIPLVKEHGQTVSQTEILAALAPIFADPAKLKIAHNLKFDLQMLWNLQVKVDTTLIADTLIASYLLNPNSRSHGIDACCAQHFQYTKIPTSALIGKKAAASMLDVSIEVLNEYACEDADYALRLYEFFLPKLAEIKVDSVFATIEMPLIPVLAQMEQRGIFLDTDSLGRISEKFKATLAQLEAQIHEMAGESFNINSPKQLQVILFEKLRLQDELKITRLKKTKSGYSTDVSVLERLSAHPLPRALLEYRSLSKLLGTYVDALPKLVEPTTHRIHTSFHQWGTATGRLSSSDPNLQNIPIRTENGREIRRAFACASSDYKIISADYSQIELRILAHLTQDENLIAAFKSGEDIHTATAVKIFGESSKERRSQAKAINFGIIYGMGASRLARETGVSYKEAEKFIEKYFEGYPGIKTFINNAVTSAKAEGLTRTISGRMRPFIEEADDSPFGNPENIAVNTPIQGSAADLVKMAMIQLETRLSDSSLRIKMLLQVHDELIFECHQDDLAQACDMIKQTMENAMKLTVPLKVEVGSGNNWLEAH